MDSEELMKTSAIVLAVGILLVGCHKAHGDYVALPRQVITDYNAALTEAQDRAAAYQAQAQRLAELYHKNSGHKTKKDKKRK